MAQKFVTPVTIRNLTSASSDGLAVSVDGDTNDRIKVEAGGRLVWGSGSATGDANLYRSGVGAVKTDHTFEAESGVITLTSSGAPTSTIADGAIAVDTTNSKFYYRSNSAWNTISGGATVSTTAPGSPSEGDIWFDSNTGDTLVYYGSVWVDVGGSSVANIAVQTTAPSNPVNGDLWFDTDTAKTYVWYDDGTSAQWVEVGAASAAASGTDGAIQFASGGTFASDASNLVWDDTNNRLGIGTTTPARPLEVDGGSIGVVATFKSSNATGGVSFMGSGTTGDARVRIGAEGDDLKLFSSNLERMRIDSSGNVGIGTATPGQALEVSGRIYATGISGNAFPLELNTNTTSCRIIMKDANSTSSAIIGSEGDDLIMRTNGTERVRVDVDGKLILSGGSLSTSIPSAVTGAGDANGLFLYAKTGNGTARLGMWIDGDGGGGDLPFVVADTSSNPQCVIYGDGDLANVNNAYDVYSDMSLKQDIVDANPQWDDIKAVQLRNFRLIADVEENGDDALVHLGVVAQELESAGMAGLVKTFDGQPKRVKASILYMKAIGALQEAMARIETLEVQNDALVARIEALEAN